MAISDLFFGSYTIRNQRRIKSILSKVNSYKDSYADLNESDFKSKTNEFRQRLRNGESTTDILPEALAVCRQATKVALNSSDTNYFGDITTVGSVAAGIPTTAYINAFDVAEGVTKVRIYMWIEGQDVDCEDHASGSALTYNLQFSIDSSAS